MVDTKGKWAFWGLVLGTFALSCLPTVFLADALSRYRSYLNGVNGAGLRPTRVRFVPHRDGKRGLDAKAPLDFVEFSLVEPKAKSVAVIGDFNGWKQGALPLARGGEGRWQIVLPLAKGRHGYLFVVDGASKLDPSNRDTATIDGRKASVRVVR